MSAWADFSTRSVRCPRCRRYSPEVADHQAAITWTDSHDCKITERNER